VVGGVEENGVGTGTIGEKHHGEQHQEEARSDAIHLNSIRCGSPRVKEWRPVAVGDLVLAWLDKRGSVVDIPGMRARPDLVELASLYAGLWVALDPQDGSVIATGESIAGVLGIAEAKGIKLPLILHPSRDYGQLAPWHG
jgi:Family of unknown function (DUF5678)